MKRLILGVVVGLGISSAVCRAQYPTPLASDADTRFLYQFNEIGGSTAFDTSGAGRNATYGPDVTRGQPTVFESGNSILNQEKILLDSAVYWQAPSGSGKTSLLSLDIYQQDFTVQMWVNWNGVARADAGPTLFAIQPVGSTSEDLFFGVLASNNVWHPLGLTIRSGNVNLAFDAGGTAWQLDTWYHVAMVVDHLGGDTNYKIYWTPEGAPTLNLVEDYTRPEGIVLDGSSADRQLIIGQVYGASGQWYWPGEIDGFKFSNQALSEDELDDTLVLIPEPASVLLLVGGLVAAWQIRRRA